MFTVSVKMKQEGELVHLLFRFIEFFFFHKHFFFSNTSTTTSKTKQVSVITKVGYYQFSNCDIWDWQHKVTFNVTFHPFKRLRKIPERKFWKRVHQIPVINVARRLVKPLWRKFYDFGRIRCIRDIE